MLRLLVDIRFQVLFHSAPAVLFTFPSRYWFTIGHIGVFSLTGWSRSLPSGFHVPRRTQDPTRPLPISPTGFAPSSTELSISFDYLSDVAFSGPTTPVQDWFGLFRFRSPLLSESLLFSSPPGTKMFQFPGLPSLKLCIGLMMIMLFDMIGFPHSDISGSMLICSSPKLFAACHVLHRLLMPRHSPCALISLT